MAGLWSIGLFTGCVIRSAHQQAEASLDLSKHRSSGVSPDKNDPEVGWNVGYLMIEEFEFGIGGNYVGHKEFDQADPASEGTAGGPSDGQRTPNYNFIHPRPAVSPDNYFTLSEEIEFINKPNKIDAGGGDSETDQLYYLEVPILLNYNLKVNGGNNLYFGLGPYAAVGLFAHYSSSFEGQTQSGSLKFGSNADFPRMDYGLQAKAGYMITPKISLALTWDLGLRNLGDSEDKAYNNCFGFNVGYRFK